MVSLTNFRIVSELSNLGNDEATENLDNSQAIHHHHHEQRQQQQQHNFNNKQQDHYHDDNQSDLKKYHFNQTTIATIDSKCPSTNKNFLPNRHKINSEHFEIRWNNLNYQVEPKWYRQKLASLTSSSSSSSTLQNGSQVKSKTNILNNLSGSVKSGQVTAILGPSGAGKTSLLGCLTGKNKSGVSGSVQVISNRNEPMSICTIPQKGKFRKQLNE